VGLKVNVPATSANFYYPNGLWSDRFGNTFLSDLNNNAVHRVDNITTKVTTYAGGDVTSPATVAQATTALLYEPAGVVVANNGIVYFSEFTNDKVRHISPFTGTLYTPAGRSYSNTPYSGDDGRASSAHLQGPLGLFLSSTNVMYICDQLNSRVRNLNMTTCKLWFSFCCCLVELILFIFIIQR
jgi:sugar lactone lactonase YvrE